MPSAAAPYAAVMVMHNALGIGPHVRAVAQRLAGMGYAALVTDMYGPLPSDDPGAAPRAFEALLAEPGQIRARVVALFEALAAHPAVDAGRIAAIGYCFGGQCVLELARSGADVRAVVSFHGLLSTAAPATPGTVKAQVCVHTGDDDPYAPAADVAALRAELSAAGARHHITTYSHTAHAFTDKDAHRLNRPGIAYNADADQASWAATVAVLGAALA